MDIDIDIDIYYQLILALNSQSKSNTLFISLDKTFCHENYFDPPIPHDLCLLSSMNTSLTIVNLIYVVQVFYKNILKIGTSVLCCYIIILANLF